MYFGKLSSGTLSLADKHSVTCKHQQLQQIPRKLSDLYRQSYYISHVAKWLWKGCGTMWSGKGRGYMTGGCDYQCKTAQTISMHWDKTIASKWIHYIHTKKNTITIYISIASLKNNALLTRANTPVKHSCFLQYNEYGQDARAHAGGPHLPYTTPCRCTSEGIPRKPAATLIC